MEDERIPIGSPVVAPWAETGIIDDYSINPNTGELSAHFVKIKKNGEPYKRGTWMPARLLKSATFENLKQTVDGLLDKK